MANWYIETTLVSPNKWGAYITSNCDQNPENPEFTAFLETQWPEAYGATSDEAADALENLITDEFRAMMKRLPKRRPSS